MANEQLNQLLDAALARHDAALAQIGGPAPVHLAGGGVPFVPRATVTGTARDELQAIKDQWDAYNKQATAYNDALNKYKTDVYEPYSTAVDKFNADAAAYNAGPRTAEFTGVAPTAIKEFEMVAPTQPGISAEDYQAKMDAASSAVKGRQTGLDVFSDPERYNLSINTHFADGGDVSRETPLTDEEIAAASQPAFMTPKSGIGRKAGPISQALNSGEAYPAMARGAAEVPYDVAGAPVDIATMALRPLGYKNEKPVMGSDWIKEKMTELGVRPGPEANPTLQGFRTAAELGASAVNPAAPIRSAEKAGGQAAAMLRSAFTPNTEARAAAAADARAARMAADNEVRSRAVLDTQLARQAAEESRAAARPAPVQQELPLEPRPAAQAVPEVAPVAAPMEAAPVEKGMTKTPFVGRLDTFVEGLKGPVTKEQFLNQIKGKFRDYDNQRAAEVLSDLGPADKITPAQLSERLASKYSPSKLRLEIIEPTKENRGSFFLGMDNPFVEDKTKGMGVINLLEDTPKDQIDAHRKVKELEGSLYNLKELKAAPEDINLIKDYIASTEGAVPNAKAALDKFKKAEKYINIAQEKAKEVRTITSSFLYPATTPKWSDYVDEGRRLLKENPSADMDAIKYADGKVQEDAIKWMKKNGMTPPPLRTLAESPSKFRQDLEHALDPVVTDIHVANNKVNQFLKPEVDALKAHTESTGLYRGDPVHAPLTEQVGMHNPIAFSRFTEHTVPGPDGQKVKGIFLHELQSDRLDDIVKKGPAGGSTAKDRQEGEIIQDKFKKWREMGEDESNIVHAARDITRMGTSSPEAKSAKSKELYAQFPDKKEMITEVFKEANREKDLSRRMYGGTYRVGESFAGMETNKGATQQLMIKNVVAAAMQRGDEFVAFPVTKGPGASKQAQLYERLPFNAKQVIKDLGGEKMGFELRLMDLPMDNETNAQTVGLFWGKPARDHVMKTGVPFAKGGSVERKTSDNRRYL